MSNLHLRVTHAFDLLFKSFLLISKRLQGQDDLFDLILALLEHLLKLPDFAIETLSLATSFLLIASRVFNLAILDRDKFSEIFILLFQRLILAYNRLFLLL